MYKDFEKCWLRSNVHPISFNVEHVVHTLSPIIICKMVQAILLDQNIGLYDHGFTWITGIISYSGRHKQEESLFEEMLQVSNAVVSIQY